MKGFFKFVGILIGLVVVFMWFKNCQKENRQASYLEKARERNLVADTTKQDTLKKVVEQKPEIPYVNYDALALAEVKKEPKVKDLVLNGTILYIAVISDGTSRRSYADYICEVVKKSKIEKVKVVEFGSHNSPNKDNAYGVLLGESNCK